MPNMPDEKDPKQQETQKPKKELKKPAEQKLKEPETGFSMKDFLTQSEVRMTQIELTLAELKKAAIRSAQLEEKVGIILQELGAAPANETPPPGTVPPVATGIPGEHSSEVVPGGPIAPPTAPPSGVPVAIPTGRPVAPATQRPPAKGIVGRLLQNDEFIQRIVSRFLEQLVGHGASPPSSLDALLKPIEVVERWRAAGKKDLLDSLSYFGGVARALKGLPVEILEKTPEVLPPLGTSPPEKPEGTGHA
ncbi:unnamed protein product [marine sediment metagenome]|uniref:Uncharacterized protein n=1 Tax=marine sediment metagenome TaxID=412755 RepID=X1JRB8_9ZZZZ